MESWDGLRVGNWACSQSLDSAKVARAIMAVRRMATAERV